MTKHETIRHLDEQIASDSLPMIELTKRAAAGEKVSRDMKVLDAAIDVRMALTGGLRRGSN